MLCVWQGRDGPFRQEEKVFLQISNTFQGDENSRKVGWSNGNFTSSSLAGGELGRVASPAGAALGWRPQQSGRILLLSTTP